MLKTASFKRLILRAVRPQLSPMVIRLVSVCDHMPLPEFHDVFRIILGWNGDLGYIIRVHGQEFNSEFETYICNNREFIPNFGERRRQGETISTAFVESTINQVVSRRFVKKQQMQWTLRGAHFCCRPGRGSSTRI